MNGLEILLFGAFIIFVLLNLLIRFVVKKARGGNGKGEEARGDTYSLQVPAAGAPGDGGEISASNTEPFYPARPVAGEGGRTEEAVPVEEQGDITRRRAVQPEVGSGMEARAKSFKGSIETKKEERERRDTFWTRIDALPALQRAIVLSEVLGPPKGIDPEK